MKSIQKIMIIGVVLLGASGMYAAEISDSLARYAAEIATSGVAAPSRFEKFKQRFGTTSIATHENAMSLLGKLGKAIKDGNGAQAADVFMTSFQSCSEPAIRSMALSYFKSADQATSEEVVNRLLAINTTAVQEVFEVLDTKKQPTILHNHVSAVSVPREARSESKRSSVPVIAPVTPAISDVSKTRLLSLAVPSAPSHCVSPTVVI